MPNLASAFKDEIVRLARKEIRAETESLKKASALCKAETSALKKRVAILEAEVARLSKKDVKGQKAKATPGDETKVRFRAKGLISLRKRLGLSAGEFGVLVGVSGQTVYNWEAEKSRPRQQQVVAIAALRGIGKRQAAAKLKGLAG